ncbi:RadC family protein [Jannaschia donghaensis]|uniref:DNA repair protein RadC n=1 Tax=Jannaschia donghaensis TaxID=420998 RepID=A0A0M6YKE9_9RHOB|nr:DNA repair protein RadC [Jannaschia donghaensis]CTQ49737.1 DNA repair protein RadC [Jannaschia donghaensis]
MKHHGSTFSRLTGLVQDRLSGGKRPEIPTYPSAPGFREAPQQGLSDLEARMPPSGTVTQPATPPRWQPRSRLSDSESAGGGLVQQPDGSMRPHYWGHRERLRKRFLSGGHAPMPEYELLELMLFNAIDRIDVKPLAKRLLAAFGDLNGVVAASERNILRVEGATAKVFLQLRIAEAFAHRMGQAKILDREILSSWSDVVGYCRTTMAHRDTEQFRVLFLDRRNRVIADEAQAEGTVDHVPVYPREIARRALELNACALILVHNHPSGDPTPSRADIEMTAKVVAACGALDIVIHDHMIIGKDEEVSFRSLGLIED